MGDSLAATTKKSNKIRDIVRLQQMLRKWKKTASASSKTTTNSSNIITDTTDANNTAAASVTVKTTTKSINTFLKKTLSFSDISSTNSTPVQEDHNHNNSTNNVVPKGYLAVWVGREDEVMKKFVIPTDYLAHQAFGLLLREAEEEFGFQQEGILKIPCDVPLFEKILKMMPDNKKRSSLKSSSSTSSFFLYDQDHQQVATRQQQQEPVNYCYPAHHHQSSFDPQPIDSPTTTAPPSQHLQLYCR